MSDFFDVVKNLQPNFRKRQFRQAVFKDLVGSIDEITTFSKEMKAELQKDFILNPWTIIDESKSKDGSTKWLIEAADGVRIETVLMKFRDGRNTVCVSSQAGCPCGCLFCATGKGGFVRNLSAWEIISQVLLAARKLAQNNQETRNNNQNNLAIKQSSNPHLTNVVYMGMGEPMLNLDNVLLSLEEIESEDGLGLGARHITVSTCGVIEQLKKFNNKKTRTTLAISLHAPNQALREKLMPIAKQNKLEDLFKVLDYYVADTNKRISYEYLLIDGVNDSEKQAEELALILENRLAHVNLIVFNKVEKSAFTPSSRGAVERFKNILIRHRIPVTVRVSLGDEIAGACGQLAGDSK